MDYNIFLSRFVCMAINIAIIIDTANIIVTYYYRYCDTSMSISSVKKLRFRQSDTTGTFSTFQPRIVEIPRIKPLAES